MNFITVAELKSWSRIDSNVEDAFLENLIKAASSIVLHHIKDPQRIKWDLNDANTMPAEIKTATCLVAATLYENRENGNPLNQAVVNILRPLRNPALQ